ncbi:MAG TPA: four helix bundle protein [Planctomycetota bacterium]|nr:four helix bundle protein [Planctomycetota bacterium]
MATIERFEELDVWKLAREFVNRIYAVTNKGAFARDFKLRDQIRAAAVSIMSNIAEGFERGGNKEFLQFLAISKGSSGEARSQLYTACDQQYLSNDEFTELHDRSLKISKSLSSFMGYLKRSHLKGSKYVTCEPDSDEISWDQL